MFDINKTIKRLLIRIPILKIYLNNITLIETNQIETAATSGTKILYNKEFFSNITQEQQLFTLAHEFMHIILKHLSRMENKNKGIWNYATDAVINQMLKKMGLKLPDGVIDCEDAINYSSEEYYEKIKNRKDLQQLMNQYKNEKNTSHESWEKVTNEIEKNQQELPEMSEDDIMNKNKEMTENENKKFIDSINDSNNTNNNKTTLQNIGEQQPQLDWTEQLRIYKRKIISSDYNLNNGEFNEEGFYMYPYEIKRGCEVEILIDTSGSVNDELVKSFLRECKNILNETKIKIGCFDTKFYGFHEIKNISDIDNFNIEGRGGTNFEIAVNSFSNKKNLKIIFTDGYAAPPKTNLNAMWIVYSNSKINPPGGKVVYIDPNTLENKRKIR